MVAKARGLQEPQRSSLGEVPFEGGSRSLEDLAFKDGDMEEPLLKGVPGAGDEQPPKPSLKLMNFNTFAMNVEYSCLMPTVHKYSQSLGAGPMFFGFLLSIFSIARMLLFIPIGRWADKRPFREVLSCTAAIGFVGCFIYGAAGSLGNKWYLILGRVLTGIGASNVTLSRTYISQVVEADKFAKVIGTQMIFDLMGIMIGEDRVRACVARLLLLLWSGNQGFDERTV